MRASPLRVAYRALLNLTIRPSADMLTPDVADWRRKVEKTGLHIVEGFFAPEECREMVAEIDRLQRQYPTAIQSASRGADLRIFGAETASPPINNFAANPRLMTLAKAFLGAGANNAFTLAGMIRARPNNSGSGEGWHRDAFFGQFKTILYLSDVGPDNGPFEYILGSHQLARKYLDHYRHETPLHTTRITDDVVKNMVKAAPSRLRTVCGRAGALVLCNTTGIHRGCPIRSGTRYALTNYYYPEHDLTPAKVEEFKPVLGHHVTVQV